MVVANPYCERGSIRTLYLPFESFLESLCLVATLKALPCDEMLAAAGDLEGWHYVEHLREWKPAEYAAFVRRRKGKWGVAPNQPLCRTVDHLIRCIVHRIDSGQSGNPA